jgi:hypothetical protein
MRRGDRLVVRLSPLSLVVVFVTAAFFSLLFVAAPLAILFHRQHPDVAWVASAVAAFTWTAVSSRARASFGAAGIEARNAWRSYSVRWDEVAAVRLIPAVWYCADFRWAAMMLEIEGRDGSRFPLRCSTHLSRRTAEKLGQIISGQAGEFGFMAPTSLLRLWKLDAVEI